MVTTDRLSKIGNFVDNPRTSAEAIVQAGLDWEVHKRPVFLSSGHEIADHKAIIRGDTREVLSIVSNKYEPFQNREAFAFMDDVVEEQLAAYERAGSVKGGRIVWMLLRLPEDMEIGGDTIRKYLRISTSHDGSGGLSIMWQPLREVCSNTLAAAIEGGNAFKTRHTSKISGRVSNAVGFMKLSGDYFAGFMEEAERLVATPISRDSTAEVLTKLFGPELDVTRSLELFNPGEKAKGSAERAVQEASKLVRSGAGNAAHLGNAWGVYNGITEYLDHAKPVRGSGDKDDADIRRMAGSWFGSAAGIRQRAWDLLTV